MIDLPSENNFHIILNVSDLCSWAVDKTLDSRNSHFEKGVILAWMA